MSITHPLNATIVAKTARKQLAAAEERERTKNMRYELLCRNISAEFVPLVIESYGGYGQQMNYFLSDLHNIAKNNLTLTDGDALINDMLDQIAFHIINLNGVIMKLASSPQGA